ncbi:MAG: alpha/beta fold hydrolase [Rhodospirillaceae bacterium]|jgi:esterase|nr:alpha/beta fold hydrolase [Rhodospirillaceae bacterium]MBT4941348.1 alpha/beta fold hydrolase [Rhodospirillaceae bacterium]MBT7269044.1 alpha/beta fold hydrolase [Rhodospirillaceae bacterium]
MTLAFTDTGNGDGNGETLVILHGLFGSGRNWASIARALSDTYRVLTVDLPNHGASSWTETITYEGLAQATANFLTEQGLQGAALLGHSMGGKTAMTMALKRPELISSLIVADIAPVPYDHDNLAVISALDAVDLTTVKVRDDAEAQLAEHISDRMMRAFLLQNLVRDGDHYEWRINLAGLKAGLPNLHGFPVIPEEVRFEKPAIFIAGAESDYVEPDHHEEIDRLFPNSSVVDLTNAGHWLHADNPEAFVQTVRGFLAP